MAGSIRSQRILSPRSSEVLCCGHSKTQFGSPGKATAALGRQRLWGGGQVSLRHRSFPEVLWLGFWPARQQSLFFSSSCPQRGRGSPGSQSTLSQVDQGLQVGRGLLRILGGRGDSRLSLSQEMGQRSRRAQKSTGIADGRAEDAGPAAMLLTVHSHPSTQALGVWLYTSQQHKGQELGS